MRLLPLACLTMLLLPAGARAQAAADTALRVTIAGFVDGYYAWDFGEPPTFDRSFAGGAPFGTQPARHNEFNVNLAFVDLTVHAERVRGRIALQAGTSVQANYAGEGGPGVVSGGTLARHLQEAYAGYAVTPALWVDGGIFFSHMGMESWISRDNPTYTRSLVAEMSPYYSSGVRATWAATGALALSLHLVNGWQNITETNADKGLGLRADYAPSAALSVSYYGFVNNEAGGLRRILNGGGAQLHLTPRTALFAQVDAGSLERAGADGSSRWWGFALIGRLQATPRLGVAARVEHFDDPDQVNVATALPAAFDGTGYSANLDVQPHPRVVWRTEVRGFTTSGDVFPEAGDPAGRVAHNLLAVTSLALTF